MSRIFRLNSGAIVTGPWTVLAVVLLATMTSSLPLPRATGADNWPATPPQGDKSHLLMWLRTEKQLLPRVTWLVDTALELLQTTCGAEGMEGIEECRDLAESLPTLVDLQALPSPKVLKSELKKTFVKVLVENAYQSLLELQSLLSGHVFPNLGSCGDEDGACSLATQFKQNLDTAVFLYRDMLASYFSSRPSKSVAVTAVETGQFASDNQLAIKALHLAFGRLAEIQAVLEYSVQFSWFSRFDTRTKVNKRMRKTKKKKNARKSG